jgi:D-arabinose 1-dehydrogenase-like Zn-dependent alcohol dehydrogenase
MTGGVGGLQGSLAEFVAADARLLAPKPINLGMRETAALPLIFITAWEGLVDRAHVGRGQKVLVQGGAGGVGHIVVQLAQASMPWCSPRAHSRIKPIFSGLARHSSITGKCRLTSMLPHILRVGALMSSTTP